MNRALWTKTIRDGWWLLAGSAAAIFAFHWIHVWINSHFKTGFMRKLLPLAPDFLKNLSSVPLEVLVTPAGRLAVTYDHPLVIVLISYWAISRGSDCVSGEIGRGTMEMLLAPPVRRWHVVATQGLVTMAGAALLAVAGWLGTWV